MSINRITATAVIVLLIMGSRARAHDEEGPHDHVFKISKTGEVKFDDDVRIGDALIKKGKYVVVDRAERDIHVLVFTATGQKNADDGVVREVRMRLISSRDQVKASVVVAEQLRDHSYRVTLVRIAGEAGDHVPEILTKSSGTLQGVGTHG